MVFMVQKYFNGSIGRVNSHIKLTLTGLTGMKCHKLGGLLHRNT